MIENKLRVSSGGGGYPFTNNNFFNYGATGNTGPTNADRDNWVAAYLIPYLTISDGIQYWTVPAEGNYRITASGAEGGDGSVTAGGKGAVIEATIPLEAGEVLAILVGQEGESGSGAAGGGGGTFVVRGVSTPLLIAGGGGSGGGDYQNSYNGVNGSTHTQGTYSTNSVGIAGGNKGNSGNGAEAGWGYYGAGGGGMYTDGNNGGTLPYILGGKAFVNGGQGGNKDSTESGIGGFGGGGGSHTGSANLNGGGGGYSGGAAGGLQFSAPVHYGGGGGGGSFIHSTGYNVTTTDGSYNGSSNHNGSIQTSGVVSSNHGSVNIVLL